MAQGEISRPSPEFERSFLVPFVVDYDGQRFGKYPPGWPAALSLGVRAGVSGWVNPLLSALTLWLTYRLANKLLSPGLSVVAELLLLSSPMFLMLSGTFMSHAFSLFLTLAFMLAWCDLFIDDGERSDVPEWMLVLVAGGSLGLLVLTRPLTAAAIALPFVVYSMVVIVPRGRTGRQRLIAIGLLSAALATILALWQWALTGDPATNLYTLWWPYDRIGFGPGVGVTESGHNISWAYYNTVFSLRAGQHDLFGWPYVSWLLLPFGLIGWRRRKLVWLQAGVFLSLVCTYALYWIGSWLFGPRYYFEAVSSLSILSAAGFGWVGGWLQGGGRRLRVRRRLSLALIAFLMLMNAVFYLPRRVGGVKGLYEIDRQTSTRFVVDLPGQTMIIIRTPRWYRYARYLYQVEPFMRNHLLIAWSRGEELDKALIESLPSRTTYYYDVEERKIEQVHQPRGDG